MSGRSREDGGFSGGPRPCAENCTCMRHKRAPFTLEHRARIGAANRGRKHTVEARARMVAGRAGGPLSEEHRAKISSALKGRPFSGTTYRGGGVSTPCSEGCACGRHTTSDELRQARSESMKRRLPELNRMMGKRGSTEPERRLYSLLTKAYGAEGFIVQHPVGRFTLDAYTPEDRIAWEADGSYWHGRKDVAWRDVLRDNELTTLDQVAAVVRLGEMELRRMEV
jgi:very-short-patch-repair endonuclease